MKTHLALNNYDQAVACGMHTSWAKRFAAKRVLNLTRTTHLDSVDCARCRNTHTFDTLSKVKSL